MSIVQKIENLRKLSKDLEKEANDLEFLLEKYPDLRIFEGRWKKIVSCSKLVNNKVDKFDMRYNCGCCDDSPLEIWPYLETENGKVYSDPPRFMVSEKGDNGDIPWYNYSKELIEANLNQTIINQIIKHFESSNNGYSY